jgi:hypothetical protein
LIEITKPSHSGRLFDGKKYGTERTDRLPELMTWKIRIEQNSAFGCFFHSIKGGKHVTVFFLEIAKLLIFIKKIILYLYCKSRKMECATHNPFLQDG